jgi:hypothetical protein
VALLKELELLKDKKLCLMMDLTPCLKRSIYGVGVAYSWVEDGRAQHKKVLLPLTEAGTKDGELLAEELNERFSVLGLNQDNVQVTTADGGGDNNGNDRVTGKGITGTIYNSVSDSVWVWCAAHLAQLCGKDGGKHIPTFFFDGLRLILTYVRRGEKWGELQPHMAHLSGATVEAFKVQCTS